MSTPPENQSCRKDLGELIAEFRDVRAGIFAAIGYTFAVPGTILVVGSLLALPPRFLFNRNAIQAAIYLMVFGTVSLAVGKFLGKKHLAIYQHGITQVKWGATESLLWRDVRRVFVERETHYGSGLAYRVRYRCSLERSDGTWLPLNAVPITSEVMNAFRKSAAPMHSA
jgi:hypothetical protein